MKVEYKKQFVMERPKNISQFAEAMGVSREAVYSWLNGSYMPSHKRIEKIRQYNEPNEPSSQHTS